MIDTEMHLSFAQPTLSYRGHSHCTPSPNTKPCGLRWSNSGGNKTLPNFKMSFFPSTQRQPSCCLKLRGFSWLGSPVGCSGRLNRIVAVTDDRGFAGLPIKKSASRSLGPSNGLILVFRSTPQNVAKRRESPTWCSRTVQYQTQFTCPWLKSLHRLYHFLTLLPSTFPESVISWLQMKALGVISQFFYVCTCIYFYSL
jgi:hypothetical protein